MTPLVVAIDGPAGAGKSSVALEVAKRLGLSLLDTGALYRCVALAATQRKIPLDQESAVAGLLPRIAITFESDETVNRVFLDGVEVTSAIRTPEISRGASVVGALPAVRSGLLSLQRRLAREAGRGAVVEGRDIGTVVFPDAPHKFFITASAEVRALRRHKEFEAKGTVLTSAEVLAAQRKRDRDDETRSVAPLRPADDAILIDTSALAFDEVTERVISHIQKGRDAWQR